MVLQSTHRALCCFDLFLRVVLVIHIRHRSVPTTWLQCWKVKLLVLQGRVIVLQSKDYGVAK
jgi:hypothetical protein